MHYNLDTSIYFHMTDHPLVALNSKHHGPSSLLFHFSQRFNILYRENSELYFIFSICVYLLKRNYEIMFFDLTEGVLSNNPLCKNGNARFTTVPLKALSGQFWIRYSWFCFFKLFIFLCGFYVKETCAFIAYKEIIRIRHFSSKKNDVIFHVFIR